MNDVAAYTVADPKNQAKFVGALADAQAALNAGNASRDALDYNKAIDNYKKACENANQAAKYAGK